MQGPSNGTVVTVRHREVRIRCTSRYGSDRLKHALEPPEPPRNAGRGPEHTGGIGRITSGRFAFILSSFRCFTGIETSLQVRCDSPRGSGPGPGCRRASLSRHSQQDRSTRVVLSPWTCGLSGCDSRWADDPSGLRTRFRTDCGCTVLPRHPSPRSDTRLAFAPSCRTRSRAQGPEQHGHRGGRERRRPQR